MSKAHDKFEAAFRKYLGEVGIDDALPVATAIFVGLVTSYTDYMGHDADKEITIKGEGDSRDVTIHPVKTTKELI